MPETPSLYADRLNKLRTNLKAATLDGFLVPMADEYQNEYVSDHDKRIEFLSGFTGSAAFIIVLNNHALFFTDSRYTLQAEKQIPKDLFTIYDVMETSPAEWLGQNMTEHARIGFDPCLHTSKQIDMFEVHALKRHINLTAIEANPIDAIWEEQPPRPSGLVFSHDLAFAGESTEDKRRKICTLLKEKGADAAIISDPASIAWLLNVRGNDVPMSPLPLSRLILHANEGTEWFVDEVKITESVEKDLDPKVKRLAPHAFDEALKTFGSSEASVMIDPELTSYYIIHALRKMGAKLIQVQDPCIMPRACKNKTEIEGMIAAHERDGAAVVQFLAWFERKMIAKEPVTEIDVDNMLTALRAQKDNFRSLSFTTIAGSGPNGAIIHYAATDESNRTVQDGEFLLIDSGAQYLDGTTDVTRTIPVGDITDEMKDRYTRVLKGHIALAKVRFPKGTAGTALDTLARQYLWDRGLDFGHGTGHGVGSYLCVHEGPQNISKRGNTPLRPGMVLSNEPGYYKAGSFGIRHENLQYVVELKSISTENMTMYGFCPLTLVPFDTRAIMIEMLSNEEKAWLNEYHAYVFEAVSPLVDDKTNEWLVKATKAI